MRRTEAHQGVRVIKFRSVLDPYEASEFNQMEAAELGVTFRRWCLRYEDTGEAGLLDRRLGRTSGKRVPVDREVVVELSTARATAGSPRSISTSISCVDHGFNWGYTWTKVFLQSKGLLDRTKTRGAHRRKRPRRPLPGMMLHQDGSRHEWFGGLDVMDLIVTMTMRPTPFIRAFWCPRRAPPRRFRRCWRCSASMACR